MRYVAAAALLVLASCAEDPALSSLKGAPLLFEATGKATNTYSCINSQWALRERGQEVLTDGTGNRIGSAVNDIYTTKWQGDDGSVATGQLAARESSGSPDEPPALVYSVNRGQGTGRFAPVATVRRGKPRGAGLSGRDCREGGGERKVEFSVTYLFYGASASR